MKKRLVFLYIFILSTIFVASATAFAEESAPTENGEDAMRLQTRLSDLGYLLDRSSGVWSSQALEAEATFREFNTGGYYAADAVFAPADVDAIAVPADWPLHPYVQGMRVAYDTVRGHLTVGATYPVTDCRSGAMLNVKIMSLDDTCTTIIGAAEWDRASLASDIFPSDAKYAPVVITIAGIGTAAVLQNTLRTPDTSLQEEPQLPYYLYFADGASAVGAVKDCRIEELLDYAAE